MLSIRLLWQYKLCVDFESVIDEHFSFESSAAKDLKEDEFFSSAGRVFHNFVPNAGNIWSRSLV